MSQTNGVPGGWPPSADRQQQGGNWARRLAYRMAHAPLTGLGIGFGVLVLAISGLFGGLEEVRAEETPTVAVGTVHNGLPWNVKVTGAGTTKDASPIKLEQEGNHWLVVGVTIEVTSNESRFDVTDALRLRDVTGLIGSEGSYGIRPDRIYLARDSSNLTDLHPNMPEQLLFFWERKAGAEIPKELVIEIVGKTERKSSLTGHVEWLDPHPAALVRVPVKDLDAQ